MLFLWIQLLSTSPAPCARCRQPAAASVRSTINSRSDSQPGHQIRGRKRPIGEDVSMLSVNCEIILAPVSRRRNQMLPLLQPRGIQYSRQPACHPFEATVLKRVLIRSVLCLISYSTYLFRSCTNRAFRCRLLYSGGLLHGSYIANPHCNSPNVQIYSVAAIKRYLT